MRVPIQDSYEIADVLRRLEVGRRAYARLLAAEEEIEELGEPLESPIRKTDEGLLIVNEDAMVMR